MIVWILSIFDTISPSGKEYLCLEGSRLVQGGIHLTLKPDSSLGMIKLNGRLNPLKSYRRSKRPAIQILGSPRSRLLDSGKP